MLSQDAQRSNATTTRDADSATQTAQNKDEEMLLFIIKKIRAVPFALNIKGTTKVHPLREEFIARSLIDYIKKEQSHKSTNSLRKRAQAALQNRPTIVLTCLHTVHMAIHIFAGVLFNIPDVVMVFAAYFSLFAWFAAYVLAVLCGIPLRYRLAKHHIMLYQETQNKNQTGHQSEEPRNDSGDSPQSASSSVARDWFVAPHNHRTQSSSVALEEPDDVTEVTRFLRRQATEADIGFMSLSKTSTFQLEPNDVTRR
jgi:hypothetical protein